MMVAGEPPVHHAPPAYHAPHHQPHYPEVPPKYAFNYGVVDHYSGANFGHSETRDGYKTEGTYNVDLPDGRKQTVNYADNGHGLEAVVNYEGEAHHPEYKPAYKPQYRPEHKPVYVP
ncbi:pro-resilin-like [Cherax quadricarinatus]|nr:pro-resilin-like [Cherax quadricarinatus]